MLTLKLTVSAVTRSSAAIAVAVTAESLPAALTSKSSVSVTAASDSPRYRSTVSLPSPLNAGARPLATTGAAGMFIISVLLIVMMSLSYFPSPSLSSARVMKVPKSARPSASVMTSVPLSSTTSSMDAKELGSVVRALFSVAKNSLSIPRTISLASPVMKEPDPSDRAFLFV